MTNLNAKELARRAFLKRISQLSLTGIATPWAINLAAMSEAAAFTATDYKAIVCIFLYGGNDYANTVIPYDQTNYNAYGQYRAGAAIARTSLTNTLLTPSSPLTGGLQFALAPTMSPLLPLFNNGNLAVQLNIGTLIEPTNYTQYSKNLVKLPAKLFSHNDQQAAWQSSKSEGYATTGWGGRIGDLALSSNSSSALSCISVSGDALFLSGNKAISYQISTSGATPLYASKYSLYGSSACSNAVTQLLSAPKAHPLENEYNTISKRAIDLEGTITNALAANGTLNTVFDSTNSLAMQLKMVANMIASRSSFGIKRQVFMVSLGGFDTHDNLNTVHPKLLGQVASAMSSFYQATLELGISQQVTAFTASDFGRTLSSDGDGSDHGWGGHHFVMGGAVKGGNMYGQALQTALTGTQYVDRGRMIPTTSVDQFSATLAKWFGVSNSELNLIAPNLGNFSTQDLGFF